jgi:hypothetical protein
MTTTQLTVGAIVKYHGSIASEHYATFYIQSIDGPKLRIVDREYPAVGILTNVHPGHVTPTGELLDLCACGHEVSLYLHSEVHLIDEPTTCGVHPCGCVDHRTKEN